MFDPNSSFVRALLADKKELVTNKSPAEKSTMPLAVAVAFISLLFFNFYFILLNFFHSFLLLTL